MRLFSSAFALARLTLTASSLAAQLPLTCPPDPGQDMGFSLMPSSGAIVWNLPVGTLPGAIPVPVVFRYQASMTSLLAQVDPGDSPSKPVLLYRGIWAGLHFGFIAPPQVLSQGQAQEGAQILEDGTEFRDQDWFGRDLDPSLPLAFGFKAPAGGYAREASGSYGLYEASLADLGRWQVKARQLTKATRFKVLMDQGRARILGYHEALKTFVPVLWVDRLGYWIEFRWQQIEAAGATTFTVQAVNPDHQGVQVAWTPQRPGAMPGELLRADFTGIPAPSLRVWGYPGAASILPSSLEMPAGAKTQPVTLAVGGPVGRPTQLVLGPSSCPSESGPELSCVTNQPGIPIQEWNFTYADASLNELRALRAPSGATSTFTFQTYAFAGGTPLLRGVCESLTQDPETRTTRHQTWTRSTPRTLEEPWTVAHQVVTETDGEAAQEHSARYTYVDADRGDGSGILRDLQVQEPFGKGDQVPTAERKPGHRAKPGSSRYLVQTPSLDPDGIFEATARRNPCGSRPFGGSATVEVVGTTESIPFISPLPLPSDRIEPPPPDPVKAWVAHGGMEPLSRIKTAGAYWVNRTLGGDTPKNGPISHSFTITTNHDGTLLHTYSWGNNGIIGTWVQDDENDRVAAKAALFDPRFLHVIGDAEYVPDIDRAYRLLAGISSETHINLVIINNCKDATDALINLAIKFHNNNH